MLNNLEIYALILFVHIFTILDKKPKFITQCDTGFFSFSFPSDNADVALVNFYADW